MELKEFPANCGVIVLARPWAKDLKEFAILLQQHTKDLGTTKMPIMAGLHTKHILTTTEKTAVVTKFLPDVGFTELISWGGAHGSGTIGLWHAELSVLRNRIAEILKPPAVTLADHVALVKKPRKSNQ